MTDPTPTPAPAQRDIRDHVVFRLSLFTTIADRNGKVFFHDKFGISLREYRILAVIGYMEPVTMMGLVNECCLDKGQVSRIVSKLADADLVRRAMEPDHDARGGKLHLTDAGRTLLEAALQFGDDLNDQAMSVLSDGERLVFSEYLNRILAHARTL